MSKSIRKRDVSPLENCGFVLHFITLLMIIIYALGLTVPEATLDEWHVVYYPPKAWYIYIPTSLVCILVSILFLNAAMNASLAPKPDSINTMWDEHSKPQIQTNGSTRSIPTISADGGLPEICDIDVSLINDMTQRKLLCDT